MLKAIIEIPRQLPEDATFLRALESSPFLTNGYALKSVLQAQELIKEKMGGIEAAKSSIRSALALQDKIPLSSSLFKGITGIGWASQLTIRSQEDAHAHQWLNDLDDILANAIEYTTKPKLDLIDGLAGVLVYGIRRGRKCTSSLHLWKCLETAIFPKLEEWLNTAHDCNLAPTAKDFLRNLGIAHGMPGLLLMTITAYQRGLVSEATGNMARLGFDHLWSFAILNGCRSALFPSLIGNTEPARLAWCYGALGLSHAFKVASHSDNRNTRRFELLVNGCVEQFLDGSHRITDASLCHGYSGLAFFMSSFAASDLLPTHLRESCRNISQAATSLTQSLNRGFKSDPSFMWKSLRGDVPSSSLLEGTSGIILALLSNRRGCESHLSWAEPLAFYP